VPVQEAETAAVYGDYTVRVWKSLDVDAPSAGRTVTIERGGRVLACRTEAMGLGALSGTDLDGSGWPNVVIETYSGGAHCCFVTYVYDLGETLAAVELPPPPGGNAPIEFADLDSDGVYEILTADDSFAYAYCAFAGSPAVRVILAYDAGGRRYEPASPRYPAAYAASLAQDAARARGALAAGGDTGWDGTTKCEVLPLVLDYLYLGDDAAAWAALDAYYRFPDKDAFRAEIEATIAGSSYYSRPAGS